MDSLKMSKKWVIDSCYWILFYNINILNFIISWNSEKTLKNLLYTDYINYKLPLMSLESFVTNSEWYAQIEIHSLNIKTPLWILLHSFKFAENT